MQNDLFSVLVIGYNNWNYFKECLDSILNQTYDNIELIISDDNGKNFNPEIIRNYIIANKKSNIKRIVINKNIKNLGTVKHLNKLLNIFNGEYVKIISVDDILAEDNILDSAHFLMKKENSLFCTGKMKVYSQDMKSLVEIIPNDNYFLKLKKESNETLARNALIFNGKTFPGPARFYTKKFFKLYGYFDENYFLRETSTLLTKALKEGLKISFLDKVVVKYRLGRVSKKENSTHNLYMKDMSTLYNKEVYPQHGINIFDGKKYVVWGASGKYLTFKDTLPISKIEYFIDSDKKKANKIFDNKLIFSPEKLLTENKKDIFIIVCSSYYLEIEEWLINNGFQEKKNFIFVHLIKNLNHPEEYKRKLGYFQNINNF